jgi:hypothetical protein
MDSFSIVNFSIKSAGLRQESIQQRICILLPHSSRLGTIYSDYQKYVPIDHLWLRCGQAIFFCEASRPEGRGFPLTAPNSMVRLTEHYFGNHYVPIVQKKHTCREPINSWLKAAVRTLDRGVAVGQQINNLKTVGGLSSI